MAAISPMDMALALLAPLSVEDKLIFLAKFTATISSSGKSSGSSVAASTGAAEKKVRKTKKAESDNDSAVSESKEKKPVNPVAASIMEKAREIRAADIQKYVEMGFSEEDAKKKAIKYKAAMKEGGLLVRMERDGLTREEALEAQASAKSKLKKSDASAVGGGAAAAAPAFVDDSEAEEEEEKPAPVPVAAKKPSAATPAVTSAVATEKKPASPVKKAALAPAASVEELEAIAEPSVVAAAKKPVAAAAAAKKPAVAAKKAAPAPKKPVYELVDGEDMERTEAMKEMGCERICAGDGMFYYVNTITNEAYYLDGEDAGVYDKESDSIVA